MEKRPGQFGIFALFVLTTVVAITVGVIRLPAPLSEKMLSLVALWMCYWCWRKRNYLHPLQATISLATRRKLAVLDFIGSTVWLPLFIWLYASTAWRGGRPVWFSDVVFGGAVFILVALATWKLVRALLPGQSWSNP